MASAGDGATPYQSGGAGGKFRKRPIRRSAQATPYDRPPTALRNNSPSLFAKLMDPASRLIYAGADRLFGVFRKRLPSIAAPPPPETREEPKPSTVEGDNLTSISAATEISELENMLKQKTFTRSEIEHLTALLHSKTTSSDIDEGNRPNPLSPPSHLLRLEPSTSTPLNNHFDEKENIHAAISTPVVTSRAIEEDVASPAELARAYMGTITPKVSSPSTLRFSTQAPRQDSVLLNTTTILPKTPLTSLTPRTTTGTFKHLENGFTTPRSRGRSAIYNMARAPYFRPPSSFSQKGINSPSFPLSQSTWEQQEGSIGSSKMASKRRSSVLDDIGSGGPVRRIRQKASLLSQASPLSKNRNEIGQKLLLRNESKSIEENGETSRSTLGYASVPTKSTQMATKILEQLERLSPKEKSPSSRLARLSDPSPSKLTSNTSPSQEKVDSPKLLLSCQDNQKPVNWLTDGRELTSQSKGKEKVEENGLKKFAVPRNVLTTMNGNSTLVKDNGPILANKDSTFKLPTEPPQKKRFQMSAHEDSLDVDDDSHSNGHVSINPLVQNKKPVTSVFANKTEVIQTPALTDVKKDSLPQADKISEMPEFKKIDDSVVHKKKVAFSFSASPPSSNNNPTSPPPPPPPVILQTTSTTDTVTPLKKAPVFPTFGASIKSVEEKPTPFSFSANEPSGFKPNAIPDAIPLTSSNVFNTVKENNQVQFSTIKKDDNGNAPKSVTMFSSPTTSSATGIFSFGSKDSSITTNGTTPASTPSTFSSSSPFNTTTNNLFSGTSSSTTSVTSLPSTSSDFTTSTPAPIFSFGSTIALSTKPPETKDTEPKSDITTTTASSIFGFSSPAATSTANDHQSINGNTGFQASFGGTTTIPSSTSVTTVFGSSAPSFGLGSTNVSGPSFGLGSAVATSSETKSSNMFSSTWQASNSSSTFGSTPTAFSFGASSTSSSPSVFGSSSTASSSSMFSFTSANSAFPAPSSGQSVFGGNSTPVFGSSPNNNDQMSMEDTMAEDNTPTPTPTPTPSPSVSVFGQPPSTPGFMFGSTQTPPSTVPFQFGGQTNQQPLQNPFLTTNQNPFQASGSAEFSAGGSFSLGSGGGDKSARRILKVKRGNRRK